MTIAVGQHIPDATFKVMREGKAVDLTTQDVFGGKRVALFAVPGAFTPTCHLKHLPGFLANVDEFKRRGVDTVACTAVNDHHVLAAWARDTGADGRILMLADGTGAFAKSLGLAADLGALGLRSRRYAAYVENGVVKALNIEEAPGQAEASSAESLLRAIPAK
jgi:glutaredoxin/glutathione-dependent peroxiredoxin